MAAELSVERRRQLLRATEEMVTAHRIEAITLEHASIANLLDQREIFDLDEIQIKQGKFVKIEADSRVQSRRGARAETEIKPAATQAVDSFKDKGINVQLLSGGYDLELRVWKEKSSKPAYAEQRKFQYPELEDFLCKMPKKQKMEYKQKVGAAIIKLAEKFREECKRLQADMDLNGVFHPEANAHRVHCIYLTMLHKNISAKTIENPVLKEMYREEQQRRREEAARDEEKAQLLREMEERDQKAEKMRNRMLRRSMDMSVGGASSAASLASQQTPPGGSIKSQDGNSSVHSLSKNNKSKHQPDKGRKVGLNNDKAQSVRSSSSVSQLPTIPPAGLKVKTSLPELPSFSSGAASSPVARKEKVQLEPPEKSFKRKLRQTVADGQVTNVFNQDTQNTLLSSEVSRLQQAESAQFKRPKDRSDAWSESMSQWMLQDLQNKQVSRVAAGTVSNVGASLGSPLRQSSFSMNSSPSSKMIDSSATGAIYNINLLNGVESTNGLMLQQQQQQQSAIDLYASQRQRENKEQWKSFGKAAVLAVDQFLAESDANDESDDPHGLSQFHKHHHSPGGGMRGVYSPSRYVPFDEFYEILKKTADPLLENALTVSETALLPASLAATMHVPNASMHLPTPLAGAAGSTAASGSGGITPSHIAAPSPHHQQQQQQLRRAMSMGAAMVTAATAAGPGTLARGVSSSVLDSTTNAAAATASAAALGSSLQRTAGSSVGNASSSSSHLPANDNNNSASHSNNNIDIVDVMRQSIEPGNFTAYEKVQDLNQPSAKLLARLNGNGGGTHRRVASHLGSVGQTAIELRDSFGRLGRNANKGFDNLFSTQHLQHTGLLAMKNHKREDEDMGLTGRSSSSPLNVNWKKKKNHGGDDDDEDEEDDPFMDQDDVVRRLERTGDLGERTRDGKMRATDMNALLDTVAMGGNGQHHHSRTRGAGGKPEATNGSTAVGAGSPLSLKQPTAVSSSNSMPTSPMRSSLHSSPSSRNSRRHRTSPTASSHGNRPTTHSSSGNSSNKNGGHATPLDDLVGEDMNLDALGSASPGVLPVSDDELDLQHKLSATWDALGVTANDRLSFMLKYSADVYAAEMSRAIDLWAGVAVCHVVLQRLLSVREKAGQQLLLVPLSAVQLWRHLLRPIPALLRLNHEALIPPTLVFTHQHLPTAADIGSRSVSQDVHDEAVRRSSFVPTMPYSVFVIVRLQHAMCSLFLRQQQLLQQQQQRQQQSSLIDKLDGVLIADNDKALVGQGGGRRPIAATLTPTPKARDVQTDVLTNISDAMDLPTLPMSILETFQVDELPQAVQLVNEMLRHVGELMQRLLARCRSDFDDEVPCGHNRYCRDFVQNIIVMLDREMPQS